MTKIYVSIALSFLIISNSANAQFGGLLNQLKDQVTETIKSGSTPPKASAPPQVNTPIPPAVNTFTPGPATKKEQQEAQKHVPSGPPEKQWDIAFQCKIGGKSLVYHYSEEEGRPEIGVEIPDIFGKPLQGASYHYNTTENAKNKKTLFLHQEAGQRSLLSTVYYNINKTTYAISNCQGMMCGNPSQPYSFSVFDGDKKIKEEFCDEDTASEFNFPLKENLKTERLVTTQPAVIIIKKSSLKFNPFN